MKDGIILDGLREVFCKRHVKVAKLICKDGKMPNFQCSKKGVTIQAVLFEYFMEKQRFQRKIG